MPRETWPGWSWSPAPDAWFGDLAASAARWEAQTSLQVESDAVRTALIDASAAGESWLLHPCLSPLVGGLGGDVVSDARLVVWVAANSGSAVGDITFAGEEWMWGHEGAFSVERGSHHLEDLGKRAGKQQPFAVPDPWGDSFSEREVLGDLESLAWWEQAPLGPDGEARLTADLQSLLAAQYEFQRVLPGAARWVTKMTRVVVPLRTSPAGMFRSGTLTHLPGLVIIEITGKYLLTLEALVHETAHLYFHVAECNAPFVAPGTTELFRSPLRTDPRPMRGVLLALHALIYMRAFYHDWVEATGDERGLEAIDDLDRRVADAVDVVVGARHVLTHPGSEFVDRCLELIPAVAT